MIHGVTSAAGVDVPGKIGTEQGKVADAVEDLVAGTFIGELQRIVDRALGAEHEQIAVCQSAAETLGLEAGHFTIEDERTAGGDVADKSFWRQAECSVLRLDGRLATVVQVVGHSQSG